LKHEGALKPESVSTKQERIAELARRSPQMAFTSLNQYLDLEWLRYAFECTRKDGAVGVDGQSGEGYALDLERNLADLLDRLKSGRYRAPPVLGFPRIPGHRPKVSLRPFRSLQGSHIRG
jgi:RNA-directed DNA polymerase